MTAALWVAIALCAANMVFAVAWWWWQSRHGRIIQLEAAVFGVDGLHKRYVTHGEFRQQLDALGAAMRGISQEGQEREVRLLAAIERTSLVIGSEVRELKQDVRERVTEMKDDNRALTARVDAVLLRETGGR